MSPPPRPQPPPMGVRRDDSRRHSEPPEGDGRAATALDGSETATLQIEHLVYLALWVSPLLAEIDRLRASAPAEPERVRVLKMDRLGGNA